MNIEIKSWTTGRILFAVETDSWKLAVEAVVRSGASLSSADLSYANLFGAKNVSLVIVIGSRHSLTLQRDGQLVIGCHCKPLTWWREHYKDVSKKEGYDEAAIAEYGGYIERMAAFMTAEASDEG